MHIAPKAPIAFSDWQATEIASLWSQTLGTPEIRIALLDGPVDLSHPCLEGALLEQVPTVGSSVADSGPATRHGTHIASLIFGQHGTSVRGIAPGCTGLILPIFGSHPDGGLGLCSQLDLARAITTAISLGAHVINVSGGQLDATGEPRPILATALRACAEQNILLVAAAGNDGCECLHVPAANASTLAVGAMSADGEPLEYSNWGEAYRTHGILAPGQDIPGATPGGGTATESGTSFAAPLVTGVAGLLLSLQRKLGQTPDPRAVRDALLTTSIGCDTQPASDCRRLLTGRLCVSSALAKIASEDPMNPNTPPTTTTVTVPESTPPVAPSGTVVPSRQEPESLAEPLEPIRQSSRASAHEAMPESIALAPSRLNSTPAPDLPEEAPEISASACSACDAPPPLAYALGQLGFDYGTEARLDSFVQHGLSNPHDPEALLEYLNREPWSASSLIWTLNQDATPIYAIRGGGPFARETYERMKEFLAGQLKEGVERVSLPGQISGTATLLNGQKVPIIWPEMRGMYSWSTAGLVQLLTGDSGTAAAEVTNFLQRIYYEVRNLGVTPQERALNYAATNAFQVEQIFHKSLRNELRLDSMSVSRSPICRPDSDCWDVNLMFFHPKRRMDHAREVYRFTIDVSDVVPVTVGAVRSWHVY